jgi:RNA polymerase sigma factor (sigma-70 family)
MGSLSSEDDQARFRSVVLPHLAQAYALARWLTGDRADAEDVVQEACLRAFRGIGGFSGVNARAWLLTIVRNYCYTWQKEHRVDRRTVPFTDDESAAIADPRATDDRVIHAGERERVQMAVDALSTELREVIVLREINDLSYREISEVVGIPMGTVMSRLARARKHLAESLGVDSRKAG